MEVGLFLLLPNVLFWFAGIFRFYVIRDVAETNFRIQHSQLPTYLAMATLIAL